MLLMLPSRTCTLSRSSPPVTSSDDTQSVGAVSTGAFRLVSLAAANGFCVRSSLRPSIFSTRACTGHISDTCTSLVVWPMWLALS